MTKHLRNQQGGVLVLYTVAMVAMMGMAALAIDLGMLRKSRAEAQRAADAAALAGASAFPLELSRAQESTEAVHRARLLVDTNRMNGVKFDSMTELTVNVIWDSSKVRTTVRRASVATWFARVFGFNSFPVGAKAAAIADNSGSSKCLQPLVFPDHWDESVSDVNSNEWADWAKAKKGEDWEWNDGADHYRGFATAGSGAETGLGSDFRNGLVTDGVQYYRDVGRPFIMWAGGGGGPFESSFYNEWDMPGGGSGGRDIHDRILTCDPDQLISLGTTYDSKPGSTTGPIRSAYEELMGRSDPTGARWIPTTLTVGGVTYTSGSVQAVSGDWHASPRVLVFPLMHPLYLGTGRTDVVFGNFAYFWLESADNKEVIIRFIGPAVGGFSGPVSGPLSKVLRLVE